MNRFGSKSKLPILAVAILLIFATNIESLAQTTQADKQVQDSLVLTLESALEIALSENPIVKIADKEIERVKYLSRERGSGLFPKISLAGDYRRSLKKQRMIFEIPGVPAPPDGIEVGQDNAFSGGISASLPIIAPTLWATLKLNKTDLELAHESARASKLSLVNQVTKAYYSLLLAQDSYEVIKHSYENTQINARVSESKYKQGTLSEFEWIRADVQTRNAKSNLVSAESAVNMAKLQLKILIGMDMDTEISVTNKLSDYHKNIQENDLMVPKDNALKANPEVKQLEIQGQQLEQSRKINIASALPALIASINYQYMSMVNDKKTFTADHFWFPTSTLGVTLNIPLFEGGARIHKNKQIKVQKEMLEHQREQLQRNLELQVSAHVDNMKKALEKSESNKEGLRQAEKALNISQKMYEVGMATFLDVSNSELLYIQAGLAYNQSIYDYLSAKSDLEKLLGREEK